MRKLILFVIVLLSLGLNAQKAASNSKVKETPLKIKVKVNGLSNSYFLLANYFGEQKYKIDSVVINAKGEGVYVDTANKIKGGVYLVVFPKLGNRLFEFLISTKEKNLDILIQDTNKVDMPIIKNSPENDLFFGDIKFMEPIRLKIMDLNENLKAAKNESEKKVIFEEMKVEEKKVFERRLENIKNNPTFLYSKLMNMMRDLDVPPAPKKADGTIDSNFQYQFYKNHYWDNFDLNDDRILYTPIFEGKFKNFFDKVVVKHPDSLAKEMDIYLAKIKDPNSMIMRFSLGTLINDFASSKIMGQDALYVHLVNNYYAKGKAPWSDSATTQKMKNDAMDIEPFLIGKKAPNFQAFDTTLINSAFLYDMKSEYKILVFWNPDCGHCKKEIPIYDSLYNTFVNKGADVFAVSTIVNKESNIQDWKNFINSHKLKFKNYADPNAKGRPSFHFEYKIKATPEVFILNKNFEIIAKKISPEQIPDFLDNYKKYHSK